MAQQVAEVDVLQGQVRNPVWGQQARGLAPNFVLNLTPNRNGGLTPYGRKTRLQDNSSVDVTLPGPDRLIGYDETGISSFLDDSDDLLLFRGRTTYEQQRSSYGFNRKGFVHLDAAGAYRSRDAYLLLDRENRAVEPLSIGIQATVTAGEPTTERDAVPTQCYQIAVGSGFTVMGGAGGDLYTAIGDADFVQTHTGSGTVTGIGYGNGRFIAIINNKAYYSTDAQTWTEVDVLTQAGSTGYITRAKHITADIWIAVGSRIWRTADGGANWTQVDSLNVSQSWYVADLAYNPDDGSLLAPSTHRYPSKEDPTHIFAASVEGEKGASWDFLHKRAAWAGISPVGVGQYGVAQDMTPDGFTPNQAIFNRNEIAYGKGKYVVITSNGRVSGSDGTGVYVVAPGTIASPTANSDVYGKWTFTPWATLPGSVSVNAVAYDHKSETFVAVGREGSEPRVWNSPDGKSWSQVTSLQDQMMEAGGVWVRDVAFDEDGRAYYAVTMEGMAESVLFTSGATSLASGTYGVYTVAYLNTPAGRLVFEMQHSSLNVQGEFGGRIEITAPLKSQILGTDSASNPNRWLWSHSVTDRNAILDDLRYDVYVQQQSEVIEGVVPENTIRYAFTEPFPDSGDGSPQRSIDEMPLGRQIVLRGLPTTSALEGALTALHQGRMWGMASQDEDHWHVDHDGISPEIANQANRFVLCYSEVGWANLMSDQSFIPIQPTQSTRFTGLLSTPQGLLVMFDNEIHIVTGDPAFDNVTVELYSDFVGCDYDRVNDQHIRPCKVGGAPFVVWTGKIWALSGGANEVSATQWLPDDQFIQVAPEPQTRSLLGLTVSGAVLRYILDKDYWFSDIAGASTQPATPVKMMLPNCACESGDNTRFLVHTGGTTPSLDGAVYTTRIDGSPATPFIVWPDLDMGMPDRRKALHVVKATFEGENIMGLLYDRTDPSFDANAVPVMWYYSANYNSQPVPPVLRYPNAVSPRWVGTLSWRTAVGTAKGDTFTVQLRLSGMDYEDAIRLPIKFFFSAGGELR